MWRSRHAWVASLLARCSLLAACLLLAAGCATPPAATPPTATADADALRQQVRSTERAFALTMADRDLNAFASFIADEAVFFGRNGAIRGKAAVVAAWKPYFDGPEPPFAWAPEQVEVLPSGMLAISSGPVFAPGGEKIASFTSIWRREAPGIWRIVFDKGCNCP